MTTIVIMLIQNKKRARLQRSFNTIVNTEKNRALIKIKKKQIVLFGNISPFFIKNKLKKKLLCL